VTWQSVLSLMAGSISGLATSTVFCQKVPASTVNSPARTPAPSSPSWVSAPPAATGVPARSPVCAAARAVTVPTAVPGSTTGGSAAGEMPQICAIGSDQARRARLNIPELEPQEGSVTCTPDSR
jgi:hypothetical protein